jgi:hypothetical protein
MSAKRKTSSSGQERIKFPARTPCIGDLVHRPNSDGVYQINAIGYDGRTVTLCLMHGGRPTNLEHPRVPVEGLKWVE